MEETAPLALAHDWEDEMTLLLPALTLTLSLIALISVLNTLTLPRLDPKSPARGRPFVSILIPARNEAENITAAIMAWCAQTYPAFELLILDDQSADETADLARNAAAGDDRVRVLNGEALPSGWTGKNWACHQLAQTARGELLLFTDADVRPKAEALQALVAEFQRSKADLLSVLPHQHTVTWGERLVVPLINFAILAYLPILAVHHLPHPAFAAAIGQCLLFRRSAYQAIGGHAAIRATILDDMMFAWQIKAQGMRLRLADSNRLLATRMYHHWDEVRNGFAKNIVAGHASSLTFLLFSTLFHWTLFILPWVWLAANPREALLLIALGVLTRALTAAVTAQRLQDSLLWPLSVLLMTLIAVQGAWWHLRGKTNWKGRTWKRAERERK